VDAHFWDIENGFFARGFASICGVDEAGRGPLAGPVTAAAVVLPPGLFLPGLNDSKKLSPPKREILYSQIAGQAVSWAVAHASVEEIERLNILNAAQLAMRRAVSALSPAPALALVDGNIARNFPVEARCVVGGDGRSASVAAASVIAKVSRDRLMSALAEDYPQYAFERHKGYPTALHYERLRTYGPCPAHRLSFLRGVTAADSGRTGEHAAARYLEARGYLVLERNFRVREGEIDLIAAHRDMIVFVEVKRRRSAAFAAPAEAVNTRKQACLRAAAALWMAEHGELPARFDVVEVIQGLSDREPRIHHIENAFI
jgi:ribonuclease HII